MDRERPRSPGDKLERQQVPSAWLSPFEGSEEARRLAELQGDLDLVDELMLAGYDGPLYVAFADRLARYGIAVIGAWCHSGLIFRRCAEKGWQLEPVRFATEDAEALAFETVAVALAKFRTTVLVPRKWDPTKGASLKTYFIGQCLLRFTNVFRSWNRERHRWAPVVSDPDAGVSRAGSDSPLGVIVEAETLAELLDQVADPRTRAIVLYKAEDYSNEEIADLCGVSVSVVKSRLYRLQRKEPGVA